jgi:peroxiredoxin
MPYLILASISLLIAACQSPAETPLEIPVGPDVGYRAPPLHGSLSDGGTYTLEARSAAATVLVFYRSAHCGLCRVQLHALQEHLGAYDRQGVHVVAITLDTPELSGSLRDAMQLDFAIVSVDTMVFHAWQVMDPQLEVPVPATYIVDRDGVIRYRHVGRNASDRATDAEIFTVLGRLDAQ